MSRGLPTDLKQKLVTDFQTKDGDTGSTEVQVALLSERIKKLTSHAQQNKHDHHNRLGLLKLVHKRRRLLNHLKREDYNRFVALRDKIQEQLDVRLR